MFSQVLSQKRLLRRDCKMCDDNNCEIEQYIPLRCWEDDGTRVYFPLLGMHDTDSDVTVERVAAGYKIKFTHRNYLIVTTLEIPEHLIVSSAELRRQICQPYAETISLPSTTDDPFMHDMFARFGACAANDPDELQKYMLSGRSYTSCIYFVHSKQIAECLRGHITRDNVINLVKRGLARTCKGIVRLFGKFDLDAWTALKFNVEDDDDDDVYYVSKHVLDVLKMTVDDFQNMNKVSEYLPYSSHAPFAELNEEYKAKSLQKQERVQARTLYFKKELMESTWHPSRFHDWCLDEDEKSVVIW